LLCAINIFTKSEFRVAACLSGY